ncbi:MAG: EamA family transporter, partial [Planctomycetia bacterium]
MAEPKPAPFAPQAATASIVAGLLTVYLVWGSTYLAIKWTVAVLPPFLMAAGRFLIAGALLYPALRWSGAPAPTAAQWRTAALSGLLLLVGGNGLMTWGQQFVPSGMAALLAATTPLWIVSLDWLVFGADRPRAAVTAGLVVGFVGAALLAGDLDESGLGPWYGVAAVLTAPAIWAVGSLLTRTRNGDLSPLMGTTLQMLTGGAGLLVVGLALGEPSRLLERGVTTTAVLGFVYLTIAGSLITFPVYTWLLK